ncbi:MAG: hypothetical protein QOC94_3706, partial [Actinoplanes sp.]|nr:hypothetical protein [Actinoplanes sp.]
IRAGQVDALLGEPEQQADLPRDAGDATTTQNQCSPGHDCAPFVMPSWPSLRSLRSLQSVQSVQSVMTVYSASFVNVVFFSLYVRSDATMEARGPDAGEGLPL